MSICLEPTCYDKCIYQRAVLNVCIASVELCIIVNTIDNTVMYTYNEYNINCYNYNVSITMYVYSWKFARISHRMIFLYLEVYFQVRCGTSIKPDLSIN